MKKAFGYCRTSGAGQVNGDGPERQRLAIQKYAAAHDIEVVQIFEDKGVPGATDWVNRPAWMDMIKSLNGTSTIIVEGLDRLARELGVQEYILADLTRRNITLLSSREDDIQSTDPARILFRQMLGSIYQYEKSLLVLKMAGARKRIREASGRCEGRKPYGTRPEEEDALHRMRNLRDGGYTFRRIAEVLNGRGLSRYGKPWSAATVHKILGRQA